MVLQIGTPYTSMWSDWQHDLIYKRPKKFAEDKDGKLYALAMANYFFSLDKERNQLPQYPSVMEKANTLDILKDNTGGVDPNEHYKKNTIFSQCMFLVEGHAVSISMSTP